MFSCRMLATILVVLLLYINMPATLQRCAIGRATLPLYRHELSQLPSNCAARNHY